MERTERTEQSLLTNWYEHYHKYMIAVSYRMLGSFSEAEDVVQDVFMRLQYVPIHTIREAKPYLTKMTVRRSLDMLKSARKRREHYVGPWLPEPEVRSSFEDLADSLIMKETISYALLVVMEQLSPGERAVFILRETLGYDYAEIAETLEKTQAACRKLFSRARAKLKQNRMEAPPLSAPAEELTSRFFQLVYQGDVEALLAWIEDDAECITDGGGVAKAALNPLIGAERVAKFLVGVMNKYMQLSLKIVPLSINGEFGFGVLEQGRCSTVIFAKWYESKLHRMYVIRNPHKLQRLSLKTEN